MYRITIKTKFNTIVLEREDYNTPEVQEILEQPYVIETRIDKIQEIENIKRLERKKGR